MLPTLKALSEGAETKISVVRQRVVDAEGLTSEQLEELLPSGQQTVFANRVSWAMMYMQKAGLATRVRRGVYQLSADGSSLLAQPPPKIDLNVLQEYPAFREWRSQNQKQAGTVASPPASPADTPEEALEGAARHLSDLLEADVLDRIRNSDPAFLESVVVDLLIAMGYGGGDAAKGQVTGKSGDGGIDGTIREDALGLDEVYVQAKKYAADNSVGEGDLRNFAGAIDAAGTTKGVFVTTSSFTKAARNYLTRSPKRIVLIDGREFARLMVRHNIGVRTKMNLAIKRIDEDYFQSEDN
ncbi:MAG: restriction endonuclease [Bryobacterales bacterium]|nr:restriction endonuclease [Bryobacterales bacterium]MDE0624205.1 restriction endonuclease [Bryobacterales bacterium]